jgi:hypothetical protein
MDVEEKKKWAAIADRLSVTSRTPHREDQANISPIGAGTKMFLAAALPEFRVWQRYRGML